MTQSKEAIKKYLEEVGGDGHRIIVPEYFIKMGFTPEFVKENTHVHESGPDPKHKIFIPGGIAEKLEGVYTLQFAYAIAADVGADVTEARSKIGRGFQAQALVRAIREVIGE